jgi:hypothetical protein
MAMVKSPKSSNPERRKRTARPFPAAAFDEALEFAKELRAGLKNLNRTMSGVSA